MNSLTKQEARDMIGQNGIEEIEHLKQWLSGGNGSSWKGRFAPSIIVRSELELFGVSTPRFAVRAYLSEDGKSFVNARRLKLFRDANRQETWGIRVARPDSQKDKNLAYRADPRKPATLLAGKTCVADALLQPPPDFSDYTILNAELGVAYGEAMNPAAEFSGTPFMRHIEMLGGGLCAQAVCFMATALRHRDAHRIFGLVEITKLATDQGCRELCISGLANDEMIQYFRAAGLNAILQRAIRPQGLLNRSCDYFAYALQAYIHSRMPVILPVDAGRLAGNFNGIFPKGIKRLRPLRSIYERNGLRGERKHFDKDEICHHSIIVVGARENSHDFLINDPLALPFMRATATDLALAGIYESAAGKPCRPLRDQLFLPITPRNVQVPLLPWHGPREGEHARWHVGLLEVAFRLQTPKWSMLPRIPLSEKFGKFRLATLDEVVSMDILKTQCEQDRKLRKCLEKDVSTLQSRLPRGKKHWVWLQKARDSIWIWDAEKELPKISDEPAVQKNLLVVLERNQSGWESTPCFDGLKTVLE